MQIRKGTAQDFSTRSENSGSEARSSDIVATTACPAFRIDADGVIIAWNAAAEEFFESPESEAVGRRCHEVVGGRDVFGNRFCDGSCPVRNMARRGEPVHHFLMDVRRPSGSTVRTGCCTLVERNGGEPSILHVFQPPAAEEPEAAPHAPSENGTDEEPGDDFLTPREREVLVLLERGEPTRDMAGRLGISVTTVRNHVQGILRKLGAHSRLEAVSLARRKGLL